MLLEPQDLSRLAGAIGRRLAKAPGKYRLIARETEPYFGCAGDYSSEAPCLGEAEAYGRALNRMHYAVNGIRPYPGEGGGGGGGSAERDPPCGNPHARVCGTMGMYNVCLCESEGYACAKACVSETNFGCSDVFKCASGVQCSAAFACNALYWQDDQDCPVNSAYDCGNVHLCKEDEANHFGCGASYSCLAVYGCDNLYGCIGEGYICTDTFHCQNTFECTPEHLEYNCGDYFTCGEAGGTFACITQFAVCTLSRDFKCQEGSFG